MARQQAALTVDARPRVYRHAYIRATKAPETRTRVPKQCWANRWHVWRWVSSSDDTQEKPPRGLTCQCGKREAN